MNFAIFYRHLYYLCYWYTGVTVSAFSLVIPVQLFTCIPRILSLFLYFVEQINVMMMMMILPTRNKLDCHQSEKCIENYRDTARCSVVSCTLHHVTKNSDRSFDPPYINFFIRPKRRFYFKISAFSVLGVELKQE